LAVGPTVLRVTQREDDTSGATNTSGAILASDGRPVGNRTLRKLARQRDGRHAKFAANQLGSRLDAAGDYRRAERWYRRAAELGLTEAAYNLGSMLIDQDRLPEAADWLIQAAKRGHVAAMFNLGVVFMHADELAECETWWRRAAEAGDDDAQSNLGKLLADQGQLEEGLRWTRQAAAAGTSMAAANLDAMSRRMSRLAALDQRPPEDS